MRQNGIGMRKSLQFAVFRGQYYRIQKSVYLFVDIIIFERYLSYSRAIYFSSIQAFSKILIILNYARIVTQIERMIQRFQWKTRTACKTNRILEKKKNLDRVRKQGID